MSFTEPPNQPYGSPLPSHTVEDADDPTAESDRAGDGEGNDAARLADLVDDDMFSARVTVLGSYSYDTQIGGNTTVPQRHVDGVTVLN